MADLKLVGAVAVKVRPDTRGFLGETKRGVTEALRNYNPEVEVGADVNVDTRAADRKLDAFEREHDGKELNMRVRVDYDSLRRARDRVNDRLKDFDNHKIKYTADEEGLRKLRDRLDDLSKRAKVEVNWVEDEAGYRSVLRKIENIRREKSTIPFEFKTDDASLARAEAKAKRALDRLDRQRTITLEYDNDYASMKGAMAQLERRIKDLSKVTLETRLNKTALLDAQRELRKQMKDAEFKVRFVKDEGGYKSVLAQIKKIRDEKNRSTTMAFKTDAASLRAAEKEALAALAKIEANRTIELRYTNDYDGLRAVRAKLDAEIAKAKEVKVTTKLDSKSLQEARDKIDAKLAAANVTVKYSDDADGYQAVLERIKQIRRERAEVDITFATDDASLAAQEAEIKAKLDATEYGIKLKAKLDAESKAMAERDAKELQRKIDDMKASIEVGVHTGGAAAQLAYTSRSRIVDFYVKVNKKSLIVAEGLLKSLTGVNTLNTAGRMLESLFVSFDKISLITAGITGAIGSLLDVALYATSSLLSIGGGIAQAVGLLATAPAMLSTATAAVVVYIAAFKDFKGAIDGNAEAMAALPPAAQAAATSLQGVWTAIQKPIQSRFWDGMGTSIQDAVDRGLDPLKEGLADTGEAFGALTGGILDSFTKIADSGDLATMFGNLSTGMGNLSEAAEPFFDAFNKLGLHGSEFLPRFGTWVTDLATTFDAWITRSADAGKITEWIDHGVTSLQNMWDVAGSTIGIFQGLTQAANDAGATGLAGFTIRMQNIADMVGAEPFQTRLSTIFEGAREGAGHLNEGFKTLSRTVGESAVWVSDLLTRFGRLGEEAQVALAIVFGNHRFQSGTVEALDGMLKMAGDLGPAFDGVGSIIGNLAVVAGAVFSSIGLTVGAVVKLLDESVGIVLENVSEIAPRLLGSVEAIITTITPTVLALVTGLDSVLGFVNDMPAGVAIMTASLGAFLALRGLFSAFYKSFANTKVFQNMQGHWLRQQAAAGLTQTKYKMVNGELQRFVVPTGKFSATRTLFATSGEAARRMSVHVQAVNRAMNNANITSPLHRSLGMLGQTAVPAARRAMGGLMTMLGGPWGVALAIAGLGVAAFAQKQQKAKADVDALSGAIDKQTGAFTEAGLEQIAKSWTDLDEAGDKMANFWRGFKGAEGANETAEKLGLSIAGITQSIADGGPEYDAMVDNLQKLGTNLSLLEGPERDRRGMKFSDIKDGATEAAKALGFTVEELEAMGVSGASVAHLASNIREQGEAAAAARVVYEGLAKATGTSTVSAEKMAAAMQTIGDQSQTAASKVDAIRVALDLLKGGAQSAREAEVAAAKAAQSAVEQAAGLHDEIAEKIASGGSIIQGTTGLIDQTTTTGVKLFEVMKEGSGSILAGAQAAYQAAIEAKKTPEEAMDAAMKAMGQSEQMLKDIAREAGVSADSLRKEWEGFFGEDWELQATFSASAEQFMAVKKVVEDAGLVFDQATFDAFLDANPDPANVSISEATRWGEEYAAKQWVSRLDSMNADAMSAIANAVGAGEAYKNGDYTAVLEALNAAGLGTDEAWQTIMSLTKADHQAVIRAFNNTGDGTWAALQQIMTVTGMDHAAAIKALADWDSGEATRAYLDGLTKSRTAWIVASYTDDGSAPGRGRQTDHADGGFMGVASRFKGVVRQVRAYANGGLSPKPTSAHIAPAGKYVMYAEKETGGEAFIPLSAAKRSRSVAIWQETGRRLGVDQYANGGIRGGGATRSAPVINVTNNYPVPEKTSTTVNRSLQFAAAIDPF